MFRTIQALYLDMDVSAIVGTVGGALGAITFLFSVSDYIKTHIVEPNRVMLDECISISYGACFNSKEDNLINKHDFALIFALTGVILTFENSGDKFHGWRTRRAFQKVVDAAKQLDSTFEHFTAWSLYFGPNSEHALEEYTKRQSEITVLESAYKEFYRMVRGSTSHRN